MTVIIKANAVRIEQSVGRFVEQNARDLFGLTSVVLEAREEVRRGSE